jgi:hypothetical protein
MSSPSFAAALYAFAMDGNLALENGIRNAIALVREFALQFALPEKRGNSRVLGGTAKVAEDF